MDYLIVIGLCTAIWGITYAIGLRAWHRDKIAPADDIGVQWLFFLALYTTLPPLFWLLQGAAYDSRSNPRLFLLQPSFADVTYLLGIALAYTGGFALAYGFRSIPEFRLNSHCRISAPRIAAAIGIIALFQTIMLAIRLGGAIESAESYIDSYRVFQDLPLLARQGIKIGSGLAFVSMLVVVVGMLQRWPKRGMLAVYIATAFLSFDVEGARSTLFLLVLTLLLAWHILVRPIAMRWWVVGCVAGLLLFMALGLRREAGSWSELSFATVSIGEFDQLWANSAELLRERDAARLYVPPAAQFGEFWSFIPSQALPFEKLSLADWFLTEYYPIYQQNGGGLAFGMISQGVVGAGIPEGLLRGIGLGFIAAWIMRWYRRPTNSWWHLPLYLYLLVFVHQSVRDTTFRAIGDVVQLAVPALLIITFLGDILKLDRVPKSNA